MSARGVVVSLCDRTGHMVRPWAEAGFDCVCFDLQHSIRRDRVERVGSASITYRWADVRSLTVDDLPAGVAFAAAFPPCTHLAVSGARDFARKGLRLLIDALEVVEACRVLLSNSGAPWMIENPVGRLSTLWRRPDFVIHPHEYAGWLPEPERATEAYTKATCLWTGGGFRLPERRNVDPALGSLMHLPARALRQACGPAVRPDARDHRPRRRALRRSLKGGKPEW